MVIKARYMGLMGAVVLMGYYNPFLYYEIKQICEETKEAGWGGFIVVNLPPDEVFKIARLCMKHALLNVPLVFPTVLDQRISYLSKLSFTLL